MTLFIDELEIVSPSFAQNSLAQNDNSSCRKVEECYTRLNKISEGVYGVVHRAKCNKTSDIVALKRVKIHKSRTGFPIHSIREIKLLQSLHHDNIINVREIVISSCNRDVFMVMDYADNDIQQLMYKDLIRFKLSEIKCLLYQLIKGVSYLHEHFILHRDLKTANLLLTNKGVLKICDLGMARRYGNPLKPYTNLVVTLWYRAPELLLGSKLYGAPIDVWSIGCIFYELLTGKVLFEGNGEFEQISIIFDVLGTPNDNIWKNYSSLPHVKRFKWKQKSSKLNSILPINSKLKYYYNIKHLTNTKNNNNVDENGFEKIPSGPIITNLGLDLFKKLLTYDPTNRITTNNALKHEWFTENPQMCQTDEIPKYNEGHKNLQKEDRPQIKSIDNREESV